MKTRVVTRWGIFERDPVTGFYEPFHPEETHYPIWLGIGIPVIASWVIVIWFCLALAS